MLAGLTSARPVGTSVTRDGVALVLVGFRLRHETLAWADQLARRGSAREALAREKRSKVAQLGAMRILMLLVVAARTASTIRS